MLILDEADEMLNMGFREDIDIILEKVPSRKTDYSLLCYHAQGDYGFNN